MKKLVIFDLDGTLLNTIDDLGFASNHALAEAGMPTHHISSYPHFVGNGITKLIERVVPSDQNTPEIVARLRKSFVEFYDEHNTDHTAPYPGINQLLEELTARDIAVAVTSNKYQAATTKLIGHYFPDIPWVAVEGQTEGMPVKPDPSIVFKVLSTHPTPKAEVLYVGDSEVDMVTARRAGIESVGVTWGFCSVRVLAETYADHIINAPTELLQYV